LLCAVLEAFANFAVRGFALDLHAVFIPGLPKLPSWKPSELSFRPDQRYNVFRFQAFSSLSTKLGLASNLYYKGQAPNAVMEPLVKILGLGGVNAGRHGGYRLLSYLLGDAVKITKHARFGVLERSPKRS
jgi:hypothetical protein